MKKGFRLKWTPYGHQATGRTGYKARCRAGELFVTPDKGSGYTVYGPNGVLGARKTAAAGIQLAEEAYAPKGRKNPGVPCQCGAPHAEWRSLGSGLRVYLCDRCFARAAKRKNPVDSGRPSTLRKLYGDRQYRDAAWMPDTGMSPAVVRKLVERGYATQSGPFLKVTWKGMNATEKGAGRLVPTLYGEVGGYALYDTVKGDWLTWGEIHRKVGGIKPTHSTMPRVYGTWREARDAAAGLNPLFEKRRARA